MFKKTDELNRELRRNVYVTKVKDVASFIQLINNIYKSIIGKSTTNEFFYKFDRALSVNIVKQEDQTFKFTLNIRNIKSNLQLYMENLYSLLYLFFANLDIRDVSIDSKDLNHKVHLIIAFNSAEDSKLLIRDILLRIKFLKKPRSTTHGHVHTQTNGRQFQKAV